MFLHQQYLCPLATGQNTTHKLHLALKFICILYHPTEQQKPKLLLAYPLNLSKLCQCNE